MLSPSKSRMSTNCPLCIRCTSLAGIGSVDRERLKPTRVGGPIDPVANIEGGTGPGNPGTKGADAKHSIELTDVETMGDGTENVTCGAEDANGTPDSEQGGGSTPSCNDDLKTKQTNR